MKMAQKKSRRLARDARASWCSRRSKLLGPLHGYGIARRIEQTSGNLLSVNYGTLYPSLLKLEQGGYIASEWGVSDNNRKGQVLPPDARRPASSSKRKRQGWEQMTAILARFFSPMEGS
jgi:hypothetical protein